MPDDKFEELKSLAEMTAGVQRERSAALEAVLSNAADMGVDSALKKYGGALSPTERDMIRSLDESEIAALKTVKGKLGSLSFASMDNNNNV